MVPVEQTARAQGECACMPRALTMTPRNMVTDLKIPRHDLAHVLWCQISAVPTPSPPVFARILNDGPVQKLEVYKQDCGYPIQQGTLKSGQVMARR